VVAEDSEGWDQGWIERCIIGMVAADTTSKHPQMTDISYVERPQRLQMH